MPARTVADHGHALDSRRCHHNPHKPMFRHEAAPGCSHCQRRCPSSARRLWQHSTTGGSVQGTITGPQMKSTGRRTRSNRARRAILDRVPSSTASVRRWPKRLSEQGTGLDWLHAKSAPLAHHYSRARGQRNRGCRPPPEGVRRPSMNPSPRMNRLAGSADSGRPAFSALNLLARPLENGRRAPG